MMRTIGRALLGTSIAVLSAACQADRVNTVESSQVVEAAYEPESLTERLTGSARVVRSVRPFDVGRLSGQLLLVDTGLFESWSDRSAYGEVDDLARRYATAGLQLVTVAVDDDELTGFVERAAKLGLDHPVLAIEDQATLAELRELGRLVLLDTEGRIVWIYRSVADLRGLERTVLDHLP